MPFLSRDELAALCRRADLLLLASETEGFGLPVLEAMASGLPVVCPDLPALREVAGDTARFVAGADPEAYAAACREVLAPGGPAAGMRTRALARAATCTWQRTADLTARAYAELLQR